MLLLNVGCDAPFIVWNSAAQILRAVVLCLFVLNHQVFVSEAGDKSIGDVNGGL